jgi:microcystin-dependent protein
VAEPFLGEIRLMSFSFPPKGWLLCNGQLLPINQNQPLFSLLGTVYGGDGRTTFAIPDLRGRVPIHLGGGHTLGERGGEEAHTMSVAELPSHTHQVRTSSATTGGNVSPAGRFLGGANDAYRSGNQDTTIRPDAVTTTGGSQAHQNMQPFLTLGFCIALQGIFPSRS